MSNRSKRPTAKKDIPAYIQATYGVDIDQLKEKGPFTEWQFLEYLLDPHKRKRNSIDVDFGYISPMVMCHMLEFEKMEKELNELEKKIDDKKAGGLFDPLMKLEVKYHRKKAQYHEAYAKWFEHKEFPFPKKQGAPKDQDKRYWIQELKDKICIRDKGNIVDSREPKCTPNYRDIGLVLVYFGLLKVSYLKPEKGKNLDQAVRQAAKRMGLA